MRRRLPKKLTKWLTPDLTAGVTDDSFRYQREKFEVVGEVQMVS